MPDSYASNISRCIDLDQKRIFGLKSHDCHIIMEQLLPIAIHNVLPNHVVAVLVEFSSFFRHLCLKNLSLSDLEKLQDRIVITLSHLEMLFPPSFFTVMVHLTVHLVDEIIQGGPVHYRWIYFVERFLGHLKSLVGNKPQAEGSIAESYIFEEALILCSRYFEDIECRVNRPKRFSDEPNHSNASERSSMFPQQGKPVGGSTTFSLTPLEKTQAHRYVLLNCAAVKPFIEQHIKRSSRGRRPSAIEVERRVTKEFSDWFPKRICRRPSVGTTCKSQFRGMYNQPCQFKQQQSRLRRFHHSSVRQFRQQKSQLHWFRPHHSLVRQFRPHNNWLHWFKSHHNRLRPFILHHSRLRPFSLHHSRLCPFRPYHNRLHPFRPYHSQLHQFRSHHTLHHPESVLNVSQCNIGL
ncbi:uncharacterized protein LOC107767581 isoform X2 [Nicotiana tabacum]|uniref:Uncharacterized protein LOC107767581 isoform X2 n=1 Tax=Nicotiana tabacum TaxID=4097 RepID=A0AC58T6S4_TOBAC